MDILQLISNRDRLDFSQNLSVKRNYMGDTLFPDEKTQNLEAEYLRLADGLQLPTMAMVHGFDTEAAIGDRPELEKVRIEKLLIKEKINQTERVQMYLQKGVSDESALIGYVYDDMGRLAESVKTRTEVAKMEVIATGKMTVKENNLNFALDYDVPKSNFKNVDWSNAEADILGDIQEMADAAKALGKTVNRAVTSNKIVALMRKNKGIQTAIYGVNGVGTFVTLAKINDLLTEMFGITIVTNDDMYRYKKASGAMATEYYFPRDKFSLMSVGMGGSVGTGLWGVTPEEAKYGAYDQKSSDQYITITQWATPDPVAVWTKASGLFVPVLPDPAGLMIATVKM